MVAGLQVDLSALTQSPDTILVFTSFPSDPPFLSTTSSHTKHACAHLHWKSAKRTSCCSTTSFTRTQHNTHHTLSLCACIRVYVYDGEGSCPSLCCKERERDKSEHACFQSVHGELIGCSRAHSVCMSHTCTRSLTHSSPPAPPPPVEYRMHQILG